MNGLYIFICLQYVTPSNKCVLCVEFYKVLEGKGYNTVLHNSIKTFYGIPFLYINNEWNLKWSIRFLMVKQIISKWSTPLDSYRHLERPPSWIQMWRLNVDKYSKHFRWTISFKYIVDVGQHWILNLFGTVRDYYVIKLWSSRSYFSSKA